MARTFNDVMADAGISMDFQAGDSSPQQMVDREIKREEPHLCRQAQGTLHGDGVFSQHRV